VLWSDFWEKLSEKGFSYNSLREKLIEDRYIAPKEEIENDDEEIPF